jgi:hypothetical protein
VRYWAEYTVAVFSNLGGRSRLSYLPNRLRLDVNVNGQFDVVNDALVIHSFGRGGDRHCGNGEREYAGGGGAQIILILQSFRTKFHFGSWAEATPTGADEVCDLIA